MFKVGDKVICKSSVFITADFWLLKDRIYTIKEMKDDYVKFEEFRDNVKLHKSRLEKNFYSTVEMRKFKLIEIEEKLKVDKNI